MEQQTQPSKRRRSALLSSASLIIIVAGLRAAAPILQPLLLALFLAILSFPLLSVLRRRGVGTPVAILATVVAVIAVLMIFGFLMTGAASEFAVAAPGYWEKLLGKATTALDNLEMWRLPHRNCIRAARRVRRCRQRRRSTRRRAFLRPYR